MNKIMRKLFAVVMALVFIMSAITGAFAAEIASDAFRLPAIKARPAEKPAEQQIPEAETPKEEAPEEQPVEEQIPEAEVPAGEGEPSADIPAGDEQDVPEEQEEVPEDLDAEAAVSLKYDGSRLNVRAQPDKNSKRVGRLRDGEAVSILETQGRWSRIRTESGLEGWVATYYLSAAAEEAPAAEIPAEEPPAEEAAAEEVAAEEEPVEEITIEEAPTAEETADTDSKITTVGDADVRFEGNGMSEIFITIAEGTPLKLLGIEGDWAKVEIDGQIGYIYKDNISGIDFETEVDEEGRPAPKVTIFISRRTVVTPGETIYLTSKLEGLDGYQLSFQWEVNKGGGYEIVPGATGDSHSFEASVETLAYDWKLTVNFE